jgi:hypothetical protein
MEKFEIFGLKLPSVQRRMSREVCGEEKGIE